VNDPSVDPLAQLGLAADATADEIRSARRRLAKDRHPDAGGTTASMAELNAVAAQALSSLENAPSDGSRVDDVPSRERSEAYLHGQRVVADIPSFTVEALPVETFEALLVVATWIGEVLDDDPPYRLDVHLYEPVECWCRLELVPDAGASTVSLTVGALDDGSAPSVEHIRDLWVAQLNQLDWG
jgi:hypothetical protein